MLVALMCNRVHLQQSEIFLCTSPEEFSLCKLWAKIPMAASRGCRNVQHCMWISGVINACGIFIFIHCRFTGICCHSGCGHLECWTHHMKPRDCDIKESVLVVEAVEGVVALHVSRGCGKRGTAGVLVDFPWADNWELSNYSRTLNFFHITFGICYSPVPTLQLTSILRKGIFGHFNSDSVSEEIMWWMYRAEFR